MHLAERRWLIEIVVVRRAPYFIPGKLTSAPPRAHHHDPGEGRCFCPISTTSRARSSGLCNCCDHDHAIRSTVSAHTTVSDATSYSPRQTDSHGSVPAGAGRCPGSTTRTSFSRPCTSPSSRSSPNTTMREAAGIRLYMPEGSVLAARKGVLACSISTGTCSQRRSSKSSPS